MELCLASRGTTAGYGNYDAENLNTESYGQQYDCASTSFGLLNIITNLVN